MDAPRDRVGAIRGGAIHSGRQASPSSWRWYHQELMPAQDGPRALSQDWREGQHVVVLLSSSSSSRLIPNRQIANDDRGLVVVGLHAQERTGLDDGAWAR